jgi:hypothetical protein
LRIVERWLKMPSSMRFGWFAILVISVAGCGPTTTIDTDASAQAAGDCDTPNACFIVNCPCHRADLIACQRSNPTTNSQCFPNADGGEATVCLEEAQVCVGRGALCGGSGARCLPVGSTCDSSGGDPPELVGRDDGGVASPHCAFVDDVCCPGAAAPDLNVNVPNDLGADLAEADLAETD